MELEKGNVGVELSQFMVAYIIKKYAFFNDDGELETGADEYGPIRVEAKLIGPDIQMTQEQYQMIVHGDPDGNHELIDILNAGGFAEQGFNNEFWAPLGQQEVAKAWLYPDLVKLVN